MKTIFTQLVCLFILSALHAQTFTRSELPTTLNTPWEITYGPDGYLWISEDSGIVSRVNPVNGDKVVVYKATDYFAGDSSEQLQLCFKPKIGHGTTGLALHPDFMNSTTPYIYYVYSYNSGTSQLPATKFKIVRLTWDIGIDSVIAHQDLVLNMPTGYDHLGGRLMAINREGTPYLFFTVGDNGVSDENSPDCYVPQANNPNNHAQDPNFKNGKIHRFNMDGSIPVDNPIAGNSFYTRGHRNPQGLMYNADKDILFDIEHGDRTDDEINILEKGKNYGWKDVRGYHDGLFPGELDYIKNYVPNPLIAGDALKEAFFAWCAVTPPTDNDNLNWCTVAPSDGLYYNKDGIPEWKNSLLVVTLKNGATTDQELYQFKLNPDGKSLVASTTQNPNPRKFFGEDQVQNGRLRDIAVSPDGKKIYLINNAGNVLDHITVYTYLPTSTTALNSDRLFTIFPNPAEDLVHVKSDLNIESLEVYNTMGLQLIANHPNSDNIDISRLDSGMYFLKINSESDISVIKRFIKQ